MDVTPQVFRDVLGRLANGVSIVTALDADGGPQGLTATSVCSVSLEPPLVLACLGRESQTHGAIRSSHRFALSFLSSDAVRIADRFATRDPDKFEALGWREGPGGMPLIGDALSWVECDVERVVEAGDHTIFIGRVTAAGVSEPEGRPLLHFRGRYGTLQEKRR